MPHPPDLETLLTRLASLPDEAREAVVTRLRALDSDRADEVQTLLERRKHDGARPSAAAGKPVPAESVRAEVEALTQSLRGLDHRASPAAEPGPEASATVDAPAGAHVGAQANAQAARLRRAGGDDLVGRVLGNKYRIRKLLGRGGFGSVYEGVDEMLGASVAIKVLNPDAARHPDALQMFLGEARLLTALDHPNVVRWITFDRTPDGLHYFVMEFLRGKELSDVLDERGKLPHGEVIAVMQQVLAALAAAHFLPGGGSLLHLDLKPRNVFVLHGDQQQVKVIDFGISQHVGATGRTAAAGQNARGRGDEQDLRATISTIDRRGAATTHPDKVQRASGGTPLYASPEHCRHLRGDADIVELDGRTDIYSLGIMAFEMLTNRLPWRAKTIDQCLQLAIEAPLPTLGSCGVKVPARFERFLRKCVEKDRDDRFRDVLEAARELEQIANPPRPVLAIAAGVALLVVALAWAFWPSAAPDRLDLAQREVFLGPQQASLELQVRNLRRVDGAVQLVADPANPTPLLPDWTLRVLAEDGPTRVRVAAPAADEVVERDGIYLRVGEGRAAQFSDAIRVVYLPADCVRLGTPEVEGAGGRAVDPNGAWLSLPLTAGKPDWVAEVTAAAAGKSVMAQRDASREQATFRVKLQDLALSPGSQQLQIVVVDKAGSRHEQTCALDCVTDSLTFAPQLLECGNSADVRLIYPQMRPLLRLNASRPAELTLRGRDDNGRDVEVRATPDGEDFRLDLPPSPTAYRGELFVRVTEAGRVFHPEASRGQAEAVLRFRYETARPALVCLDEATQVAFVDGAKLVTAQDRWRFRLRRDNDVELNVQVRCADWQQVVALHRSDAERVLEVPLPPADGEHDLTFEVRRHTGAAPSEAAGESQPPPDQVCTIRVRRDTAAPSIEIRTAPADILGAKPADPLPSDLLALAVAGWDQGTRLDCTIAGPSTGSCTKEVVDPSGQCAVRWQDLGLEVQSLLDGDYRLTVTAIDAAGNRSQPQTASFVVAQRPPALSLRSPSGQNWDKEGDVFTVKVIATDGNGVAEVECRLTVGAADTTGWLPMRAVAADGDGNGEWQVDRVLRGGWSGRPVEVAWRGKDRFGNAAAEQRFQGVLPTFEPQLRPIVWCTAPAGRARSLRLVRGADNYLYGGRDKASERVTFRAANLPELGVPCLAEAQRVEDFYLDENEVTVADYLVFVRAADGYANASHWRGRQPDRARRAGLERSLAARDGALPAVELDLHECEAFATWSGLRLPTPIEWEYAVRGGTAEYRPFSCVGEGFDPAQLVVAAAGPRPVAQGCDVVRSGIAVGVRNLCSNVAEWVVIRTGSRDDVYAAGGSFAGREFHFSILPREVATTRSPSIGFRCAIAARIVRAQTEQGGAAPFSFERPAAGDRPR